LGHNFDVTSHFRDGGHDTILRRTVLPPGECTRSVQPTACSSSSVEGLHSYLLYHYAIDHSRLYNGVITTSLCKQITIFIFCERLKRLTFFTGHHTYVSFFTATLAYLLSPVRHTHPARPLACYYRLSVWRSLLWRFYGRYKGLKVISYCGDHRKTLSSLFTSWDTFAYRSAKHSERSNRRHFRVRNSHAQRDHWNHGPWLFEARHFPDPTGQLTTLFSYIYPL